ncbi:MAG: hypothetical protein Q9170_008075, partial [Blastenia crenularia]
MFQRDHSFLPRRLPSYNTPILQQDPSSGRIYDLYIEGSQNNRPPSHVEPSPKSNASESDSDHSVEEPALNSAPSSSDFELLQPSAKFDKSAVDLPFELYDPYPDYNSDTWKKTWHGAHFSCEGPRGVDVNQNPDDMLRAFKLPIDALTPTPIFGSYKETGLGSGYCFERHARNAPYGDEDEPSESPSDTLQPSKVNWEKVDWGRLQQDCYVRNWNRFEEKKGNTPPLMFRFPNHEDTLHVNDTLILPDEGSESERASSLKWLSSGSKQHKRRNAILLRTYDEKKYTPDNLYHIRSMITELSLHSGAEYEVFLMVQIIDLDKHIFSDPAVYQEALDQYVPREFHNISILFNVPLLEAWYPKAGNHDPNNSQQVHMTQPLQLFSLLRPDFDLYWQLELDVRYTGHHYHHLEAIRRWAQKQPRRLLWERDAYFYSPYIHKTWENFSSKVRHATNGGGIWGALTTTGITPVGPKPPTEVAEEDDFEWGVDEPADMINVSPIIDPVQTHMMFRNVLENYPDGKENTPRRAGPVTPMIAVSKRLVRAMHHSQTTMGTHMMPEMLPESTALQHGLKAVTFPEPVYLDIDDKTPEELESIFNTQDDSGMWNGGSPNSRLAQHISYWWSTGFKPDFSNVLYRRWLGIDMEGKKTDEQRLCLPPVLLHPIKEPQHWAVVGSSSAGKTTFFETLRGQHLCFPPSARSFPYLSSKEIERKDHRLRIPSRAIQYVGFAGKYAGGLRDGNTTAAYLSARYESRREDTDFTVLDYLTGNVELNPTDVGQSVAKGDAILERVIVDLHLEALVDMPVGNLSNGQTRRAKIAKALLDKPEVLLLDEPFMGLDPPTLKTLSPLLRKLAEAQAPRILLSLRPQDPLPDWITHVLLLGPELRVAYQGLKRDTPIAVIQKPTDKAIKAAAVGKKGTTTTLSREGLRLYLPEPRPVGEPIIEMRDIVVKYGDKIVLGNWQESIHGETRAGLQWTVRRGERWGVFGPNGSGKTTLLSLICSDHPQSYSLPITLFSKPRLPRPGVPGISLFDLQSRIGHSSPETHNFFPKHLSLRRTLESAWSDTFLSAPSLTYERDELVNTYLKWFEPEFNPSYKSPGKLTPLRNKPRFFYLPHGKHTLRFTHPVDWADDITFSSLPFSAQRLALFLRALIKKPDLVVLDEAFSGMDAAMLNKCLLFLTWGNSRHYRANRNYHSTRPTSHNNGGRGVKARLGFNVMKTPEEVFTGGQEAVVKVEGLEEWQSLIVVSHVKEEVPG